MFNKKASGAAILIGIVAIIIIAFLLINRAARECSYDSQCGEGYYCGSDFKCHQFKTLEKTIINYQYERAAFIIGAFIVLAAIIIKLNFTKPIKDIVENIRNKIIDKSPPKHYSHHIPQKYKEE